eukprot:7898796-Ditylum_brightwellii.AAC.1
MEYKELPKPDGFLHYLEARRLRDNPDVWFINGIDMLGKGEQEKVVSQKCCFEDAKQKQDSGEMEDENEEPNKDRK